MHIGSKVTQRVTLLLTFLSHLILKKTSRTVYTTVIPSYSRFSSCVLFECNFCGVKIGFLETSDFGSISKYRNKTKNTDILVVKWLMNIEQQPAYNLTIFFSVAH